MLYFIDSFVLDTTRHSLSCDGTLLSSDERIVKLLLLLIDSAPEYVDHQTLLAQLWPNTVVSNWSVSRLVSDARKIFKHAGADYPLIQTQHGRGYRLSVEAQKKLSKQQESPNVDIQSSKQSPQKKSFYVNWLLIILLPVLLLIIWWNLDTQPSLPLKIGEPQDASSRILWVDDHPQNNVSEQQFLEQQKVAVYTTTSTDEALMLLAMYKYDVIISDMGRAQEPLAGLKLVEQLRQQGNQTPFVIYTILSSEAQTRLVQEHGSQGVAADQQALYQLLSEYIPISIESGQN